MLQPMTHLEHFLDLLLVSNRHVLDLQLCILEGAPQAG